jgi:hypothetical protein
MKADRRHVDKVEHAAEFYTRCTLRASFMLRALYSGGRLPCKYLLDRKLDGPQTGAQHAPEDNLNLVARQYIH